MSYDFNNNDEQYAGKTYYGNDVYAENQIIDDLDDYSIDTTVSPASSVSLSNVDFESNVLAQSFVFMAVALAITAITAFYVMNSIPLCAFVLNNLVPVLFAELAVVFVCNILASKNMLVPSAVLFTLYAVINGLTFGPIFLGFGIQSVAAAFGITAGMFGIMAIYGIFTKTNLSKLGSFLMMALIGIILAGVVNFFLGNTLMDTIICIVGIVIFVGLTAYDTQKIKEMVAVTPYENVTCIALLGAIQLYLDFINIFLKILRLMGRSRD